MLKAYKFGALRPDQPAHNSPDLVVARNVYALPEGYRPVGSLETVAETLGADFKGGAAYIGSDGTASLLGATATDLNRYSSGTWSSVFTVASSGRWRFTQFGDNVIGVHGGAPVKYGLVSGTGAALGGSPPTAELVTTVRDFVVLGKVNSDILMVRWSGFNDSEGWTNGTNQAGEQQMLDGGEVMGLAGGEYGLILQRQAVRRMTYVGGDLVWQFDVISANVGCMAEGSMAQAGRLVFFLAERGFQMCDGNAVTGIGVEKIDREFFASYSRADLENISAAVDPRQNLVMWAMPGNPGKIWAYNWVIQEWTTIETGLKEIFPGFTANTSLDALDALYPGGLDTIPVSLDDASFAGGNPLLFVVNNANEIGSLTGSSLEAMIRGAFLEPFDGRRARLRSVRPIGDLTSATVKLDVRARLGDAENIKTCGPMRANGDMPVRANGRYIQCELTIPAGDPWTFAKGIEFQGEPEGYR